MEKKDKLKCTCSASQYEEIRQIREKYLPKEETKMERLRRLDEGTTKKGLACSLSLGITSSLIFGFGACCILLWGEVLFIPGLFITAIGLVGAAMAQPLYNCITRKERTKIAPEILRLTSELMAGQA